MLTKDEKQMIRSLRKGGFSLTQISAKLHLSRNTVKSFCQREKSSFPTLKNNVSLCKNCGYPLTFHSHRKAFCSDQCRTRYWNRNTILTCQYCGKAFLSNGNKHRKFCGRDCYLRGRYGKGLP